MLVSYVSSGPFISCIALVRSFLNNVLSLCFTLLFLLSFQLVDDFDSF